MKAYLDASVLVSLFCMDAHTDRARAVLGRGWTVLLVSDFAVAEVSAAVARRVRIGDLTRDEAAAIFSGFDDWAGEVCHRVVIAPSDLVLASMQIRRLDLPLRAPDAIHIRVAERLGAVLVTFDAGMAAAARTLSVTVAEA